MRSSKPEFWFLVNNRVVLSNGVVLPQVAGGSGDQGSTGTAQVDGDPQAATVAAMQNASGQQAPSGNGQGRTAAQPEGQSQPNQFLDGILSQIDPAHRPIVEPYLGKWNAGVTRRFQELHGELSPYKELGADPETLGQAYQLYQMIDEDPQQVLQILQEAVEQVGGVPGQQPQGLEGQPPPGGAEDTPASSIPPELDQRLQAFEQVLETMAQKYLDQESQQTQEAEDAELDQHLNLLKQEMGDFNEPFVIAQMMAGLSGEEAVKAYHEAIQQEVNTRSRQPNVGPILGGGGAVPQEGKSVVDASSKDTKALVANILAASNQS